MEIETRVVLSRPWILLFFIHDEMFNPYASPLLENKTFSELCVYCLHQLDKSIHFLTVVVLFGDTVANGKTEKNFFTLRCNCYYYNDKRLFLYAMQSKFIGVYFM